MHTTSFAATPDAVPTPLVAPLTALTPLAPLAPLAPLTPLAPLAALVPRRAARAPAALALALLVPALLMAVLLVPVLLVTTLLAPAAALAQAAYPAKPVTLIVPFSPGGGTDITARTVATKLTATWGQTAIVENRPGAGGIIGADAVAKAKPDGYTLLIANVGTQAINPFLYAKLPYKYETAFAPISLVCELPFVLMSSPTFPPNNVKELIAYASANPGKVTVASSGLGGSPHLTAEIFQLVTNTRLTHIPYKGGGPAMTDLMAGHVDLLFASVLEGAPFIKTGKLKGLAVTHAKRSPALPEVPTIAEAGVKNGESGSWIALLAPAGTPAAIIDKVNADIRAMVAEPDMRDKLIAQGAVPQAGTPAELQKLIAADSARYGKIIQDKGLKAE